MASAARTEAACIRSAIAEHTERRAPTLRNLVEQAIAAQDAASAHHPALARFPIGQCPEDVCSEQDRLDDIELEARKALRDHLFECHGISTALANRIGELL